MSETKNGAETPNEQKMRPIAIAGFIFMIVVISWLSIQLVNVLPSAFSSLASLVEGMDQYKESVAAGNTEVALAVETNTDTVNAGATVDLTWNETTVPGSYTFSYECQEGVAVSLLDAEGETAVTCDTSYNIGNTSAITLAVDSEKDRSTAVTYNIDFLATNDQRPRGSDSGVFTVINDTIPEADDNDVVVTPTEPVTTPETETATPAASEQPTAPTGTIEPETIYSYSYEIPESDPNGFTDLGVVIIGVGTIVGDTFFEGDIAQNESGAIQFEVRNYGTKTSSDWAYIVDLPDGIDYEATEQAPLKPNEAAVITIGFQTGTTDNHTFTIETNSESDTNVANNTRSVVTTIF